MFVYKLCEPVKNDFKDLDMIIDIFFSGRIYLVLKKDFITVFESLQLLLATTAMCIDAMMRVDAQSQVGFPCSIELFLFNYRLDSQKLQF